MNTQLSPAYFLPEAELVSWLAAQTQKRRVLAPVQEGPAVVFRPLQAGQKPVLERARISPKAAILPSGDTLVRFTAEKDSEDPGKLHVNLEDKSTADVPETLIFACRSCDARGFLALDTVYLQGKYKDPYYAARRAKTILMVQTCATPWATCFCHWVGGGPDSSAGADITFTAVPGGYVLRAHSEKGTGLLAGLSEADAAAIAAEEGVKAGARSLLQPAPNLDKAAARIRQRFEDMNFWQDHTAKCLSCGACTYMCPTCQCFTITDEGDISNGRRLRSWDTCMSALFTHEASGHNPRERKAQRMRQRISHKYSYAQKNTGIFSCTGCGRCVIWCPASLDIREIVLDAIVEDV